MPEQDDQISHLANLYFEEMVPYLPAESSESLEMSKVIKSSNCTQVAQKDHPLHKEISTALNDITQSDDIEREYLRRVKACLPLDLSDNSKPDKKA